MLDQLWVIVGGIIASLGVLVTVFLKGKKAERNEQRARDIESVEKANEVRRDIDDEPDPVKRLRDKWTR